MNTLLHRHLKVQEASGLVKLANTFMYSLCRYQTGCWWLSEEQQMGFCRRRSRVPHLPTIEVVPVLVPLLVPQWYGMVPHQPTYPSGSTPPRIFCMYFNKPTPPYVLCTPPHISDVLQCVALYCKHCKCNGLTAVQCTAQKPSSS